MSALILVQQQPARAPQAVEQSPAAAGLRLSLRDREGSLAAEVARMEAQRPVMERQVKEGGPFALARQQSFEQLDVQLAGAKAELAAVRKQLANTPEPAPTPAPAAFAVQPPPEPKFWQTIDPKAYNVAFLLLAVGFIVPLSLGLARRLTRRPPPPPTVSPDLITGRLDRVDQALEAIAIEVERVAESQRFMAKIMADNAAKPVQDNPSGLDEAKPLLALGAGPIEPIRVAERQGVKQSITPH
jgi:hypothetical protein